MRAEENFMQGLQREEIHLRCLPHLAGLPHSIPYPGPRMAEMEERWQCLL
jgi:hypothetical protein